jgi:hypothetical protein
MDASSHGPGGEAVSYAQACNIDVALAREFRRKPDLSRRIVRAFGPSLPPSLEFKTISPYILKGGTQDGFKDLCRWVAVFGD